MTAYEQPTLGELRAKGWLIHGECMECGRAREIDPTRVALPDALPVRDAGRRMRCKMCKSTLIMTQPLVGEGADG